MYMRIDIIEVFPNNALAIIPGALQVCFPCREKYGDQFVMIAVNIPSMEG